MKWQKKTCSGCYIPNRILKGFGEKWVFILLNGQEEKPELGQVLMQKIDA